VRGREQIFGGECVVRSAGVRRRCEGSGSVREGSEKMLGKGASLRGRATAFGGEWVVRSAGVRRRCVGERKCSGRACRCAGTGDGLRWGMGCEVGGFNALSPQPLARTRYIYVRPAHAVKSRPWGRKTPLASTHRPRRLPHPPRPRLYFRAGVHTSPAYPSAAPTKTSASRRMMFAPAAPSFALPPRRSHFPAYPSAAPTKTSASRSSSYPQWVIHGKVIHIVARHPVQNVLVLAPAHAYI